MKKLLTAAILLTACAALCATMRSRNGEIETVRGNTTMSVTTPAPTEMPEPQTVCLAQNSELTEMAEEEKVPAILASATPVYIPEETSTPETEPAAKAAELPATSQTPSSNSTDPYRTDVYPKNVYSEELIYDADGNLIGKTTTYPTAFDSDTVWIDGKAYYNVPGFGLVAWGGPSSVTEDYTMYESGVKVGIMGGEDEAAHTPSSAQPEDWPEPTGEVVDQTISETPERSSTPPDYKPDTTPPDDPNARVIP